jgi:anti-anti-sigma regulatory factor
MRTDRGTYKSFTAHGLCERDAAGSPISMVGGIVDVTEQRQNEGLLRERRALIEQQAQAIRELSTPIMEVWDGVLTMPVLGSVDAARAERMMEVMLDAVSTRQCRAAIVDLTGVATMDADTAEHLGRLLSAVALLGAEGIVVGIKPEVARAMVSLSVDVSKVKLLANLREALLHCMRRSSKRG